MHYSEGFASFILSVSVFLGYEIASTCTTCSWFLQYMHGRHFDRHLFCFGTSKEGISFVMRSSYLYGHFYDTETGMLTSLNVFLLTCDLPLYARSISQ